MSNNFLVAAWLCNWRGTISTEDPIKFFLEKRKFNSKHNVGFDADIEPPNVFQRRPIPPSVWGLVNNATLVIGSFGPSPLTTACMITRFRTTNNL